MTGADKRVIVAVQEAAAIARPRQIGLVGSDDDLSEICRLQAAALKITYGSLDRYTGFTDQFWSKKLAVCAYSSSGKRGTKRGWSAEAFQAALVAFCFDLVAVENPEKVAKLKAWMDQKLERSIKSQIMPTVGTHKPIIIKLSLRHMKKLSKLAAKARREKMTKRTRSRLARNAAKARWHKPKVVEITVQPEAAKLSALPTDKTSGITRGANKKTSHPQQSARSEARTVRRR